MKLTHTGIALALLSLACAETDTLETPEDSPQVGCPGARLIGLLDDPSASCELEGLPPGWTATRMFAAGSPNLVELGAEAPGELSRYCAYTPEASAATPDSYDEMFRVIDASAMMPVSTMGTDCMGEAPQAGLNDDAVRAALGQAFRDTIDWVSLEELGATQAMREPPAVAVVDTVSAQAGNDPDFFPLNEHGLQMSSLIRDIGCPGGGACTERVFHALAMPRESWEAEPDWLGGGDNGTQGDIALAIYEAVLRWQTQLEADPGQSPSRLILNLSLGWERALPDTTNPLRGPARAVEVALQYAACQGVLVFVAAGNNPDEDCPEEHRGPLAPADHELRPAPTAEECAAMGFPVGGTSERPVFGPDPYQPLVYAVGGVDESDRPLINARPGGNPRLVALGTSAVSMSDSHTALTGTSVSTAVVAGTAALIWSYRPELRPHQVAELIYTSGWGLGTEADVVGSGVDPQMRRLSVCAALDDACAGAPVDACPQLGCEAAAAPGEANLEAYFSEVETAVSGSNTATFVTDLGGEDPVCTGEAKTSLASPQPEVPVCPYCNVDVPPDTGSSEADDTVIMSVDSSYQGSIEGVSMIAYDDQRNATTFVFDSEVVASLNDATVDVTQVVVDAPDTISATLIFEIDEGGETRSQSNPLTVNRG